MPLLRAHPGVSLEQVLTGQRDGQPMQQTARPADAPILEELRALRSEVAELHALVLTLAPGSPVAPATPSRKRVRIKLQPNHAELIERLKAGSTVIEQGSKRLEVRPDGSTAARVDSRTLDALVRYGMVKRDPDSVYRTTESPLLTP